MAGCGGTAMTLIAHVADDCRGTIAVYNIAGQALWQKNVPLRRGINALDLPAMRAPQQHIQAIALFINCQITYSQKIIF